MKLMDILFFHTIIYICYRNENHFDNKKYYIAEKLNFFL